MKNSVLDNIPAREVGKETFNVVIEIAAQSEPVKYEFDKDLGILKVDRFIATQMRYPVNYGFVPNTLADDGDPVDVLVYTPYPLIAGSLVECRAIGMLKMEDESGGDNKVVAVATNKISPATAQIQTVDDLPCHLKDQLAFFFKNYKALEKGKWVKVDDWQIADAALKEINMGIEQFEKNASTTI